MTPDNSKDFEIMTQTPEMNISNETYSKNPKFPGFALEIDSISLHFDLELEFDKKLNLSERKDEASPDSSGTPPWESEQPEPNFRRQDELSGEGQSVLDRVLGRVSQVFDLPRRRSQQSLLGSATEDKEKVRLTSDVIETVLPEGGHVLPWADEDEEGYWSQNGASFGIEVEAESAEMAATVRAVALRLEGALRAAKKAHLQTSEVLLPPDLLTRVARDILRMAETEPCGLRGCLILLNFESGSPTASPNSTNSAPNNNNNPPTTGTDLANKRKIGKVKCDSQTVTTFELHLSLREDLAPWYSRLPQILRNLTKGGTIVVSPAYTIAKKKLYRSH